MNLNQLFRGGVVALSTVGMVAPHVTAAEPVESFDQRSDRAVLDVALQSGGVLQGQLVNAQGAAQAGVELSIETRGRQVSQTVTDDEGYFAVEGLRGGTYVVRAGEEVATCRVWASNTAPPSASNSVLLVTGSATRGQIELVRRYGPGSLLVVGGAVTVIALAATDDAS